MQQDIEKEVAGEGVVAAAGAMNVRFTVAERWRRYVKERDTVKKDDALMRLDVTEKMTYTMR